MASKHPPCWGVLPVTAQGCQTQNIGSEEISPWRYDREPFSTPKFRGDALPDSERCVNYFLQCIKCRAMYGYFRSFTFRLTDISPGREGAGPATIGRDRSVVRMIIKQLNSNRPINQSIHQIKSFSQLNKKIYQLIKSKLISRPNGTGASISRLGDEVVHQVVGRDVDGHHRRRLQRRAVPVINRPGSEPR